MGAATVPEDSAEAVEDLADPEGSVDRAVHRWLAADPVEVDREAPEDLEVAPVEADLAADAEVAVDRVVPADAAADKDVDLAIATAMRPLSVTGRPATPIALPDRCSTPSATRC